MHLGAFIFAGSQSVGSPTEHDVAICSPIRVSPERRSSSDKNEGGRNGDKLPVKERLYLSKTAIGTCTYVQ